MQNLKTNKQTKKDLERLETWIKNLIPDDYDKFDLKAEFDSTLTYSENKNIIRQKLKSFLRNKTESPSEIKAAIEEEKARALATMEQMKSEAEMEVDKWNQSLKYGKNTKVDEFYKPIHMSVDKICQGFGNLAFIKGRGGIGKSHNIRKRLTQNKADFVEIAGEVTEAFLYRLIYENNGKIIWLKDVVKLLSGISSINLLKAATESEKNKVLTKSNYSKQQEDLPDKFFCKCKFIFDYNNLTGTKLKEDFEALVSRGDFIELPLNDDQICEVMKLIAKTKEENDVTDFLVDNFSATGRFRLNLRTQWKAINTYNFCKKNGLDWKKELVEELQNTSKTRTLLYSLIGRKAVSRVELKKALMRQEVVNNLRAADRKITEWLFMEELFSWSPETERNPKLSINPRQTIE